jgi:FecR protein
MQNQSPQNQSAHAARPGAINYVEGDAAIDNQPLNPDAAGPVELQKGQVLTTQAGKVEILLTPGVFLRVADNSTVKMVSPDLANTEVELDKGRAMAEVTDISKNNNIRVDQNGASMQLLKKGLYDFDADHNQVRVFKGKADVFLNNQKIGLGDNRGLTLTGGGKLKAQSFDERQYTDNFYRWSGLRFGYLAEAGTDTARLYVNGGVAWYGAGWYWDPWFGAYTFIPGDGIFYSPFGWGFYSPFAVYGSPFFYGGYYGYGHRHRFSEFHEPYGHGFEPRGGFHGAVGFHGGSGFHGGGGEFHGGGGGRH